MLTVTWINDGSFIKFYNHDDFKYWVERQYLNYKPYQLLNLEDAEIYAGVYRYIGHKYLGELILNKNEDRARRILLRRIEKKQLYGGTYRP